MGNKIKLALMGCLVIPMLASGQDVAERAHRGFGLTVGVALHQNRDEVLNNIRHRGPSITTGVFFEGGSNNSMYHMDLSFGFAPLKDRYSPDRSSILFHPAIEFRYAKKAVQVTEGLALFLGGGAGWSTRFFFYENWDQGHAYWLTSSHLDLAASLVQTFGNGRAFQLELDAPVLALVSRPPERFEYKEVNPSLGWVLGHIHENARLTSVHEHTEFKATIGYGGSRGGLLHRRVFWQTSFTSTRLPNSRPFISLSHRLGITYPF